MHILPKLPEKLTYVQRSPKNFLQVRLQTAAFTFGESRNVQKPDTCSVWTHKNSPGELRILMEQHLGRLTGALYYHREKGTRGLQQHRYRPHPAVQMPPNTHALRAMQIKRNMQDAHIPTILQDGLYALKKKYIKMERWMTKKQPPAQDKASAFSTAWVLGPRWNS